MGRLPRNIQELLVQNYCAPDYMISDNRPDADIIGSYATKKAWCEGEYTATVEWIEQTAWVAPTATSLGYGWHGPYITSQKPDYQSNGFSDGWGSQASGVTDHNYGWRIVHQDTGGTDITTLNTDLSIIKDAVKLEIQSYGKDAAVGGSDYDADYPVMQPAIQENDWKVSLVAGITVNLNTPDYSAATEVCSTVDLEARLDNNFVSCELSGGTWDGGCSPTVAYNRYLCNLNGETWTDAIPSNCSAYTVPNTAYACRILNSAWIENLTNRLLLLRLEQRGIDGTGATALVDNDSGTNSIEFNGAQVQSIFSGFTASSQVESDVIVEVIDLDSGARFSNICVSNNATPLADCSVVGGVFDAGFCFNASVVACIPTSTPSAMLVYPEKNPIHLNLYPYQLLPSINW